MLFLRNTNLLLAWLTSLVINAQPHGAILVSANRGASRLAPENTMAAAQAAIAAGAAYLRMDVRRSADGVYYAFQDASLERTTNGKGAFKQWSSAAIDTLDAGSWFAHRFKGEPVPRVEKLLKDLRGKVKFYFDVKEGDAGELIKLVKRHQLEDRSFFYFDNADQAKAFRRMAPKLSLKVNARNAGELDSLVALYQPQLIETGPENLTQALAEACHQRGLKLIANVPGDDWTGYAQALHHNVDLINIDNPDVFAAMHSAPDPLAAVPYRLIAHRGGIVEDKFTEYDPRSLQAAVDGGYWMLEVDIWTTRDGVLVLHHDDNLMRVYGKSDRISQLTWEELQPLRALRGGYGMMKFEDVAARCAGKVKLMIDRKPPEPTAAFYGELERILSKYDLLAEAYFIDKQAIPYFWGKARFGFRLSELPRIKEMVQQGEDVASHYFLFDHGNVLSSAAVRWCQQHSIAVVPSVNIFHYRHENHRRGAERDITFLKACGVREFQIDSDYDDWLGTTTRDGN